MGDKRKRKIISEEDIIIKTSETAQEDTHDYQGEYSSIEQEIEREEEVIEELENNEDNVRNENDIDPEDPKVDEKDKENNGQDENNEEYEEDNEQDEKDEEIDDSDEEEIDASDEEEIDDLDEEDSEQDGEELDNPNEEGFNEKRDNRKLHPDRSTNKNDTGDNDKHDEKAKDDGEKENLLNKFKKERKEVSKSEKVSKLSRGLNALSNGLLFVLKIILNPIFWILVAATIVIILISSVLLIVGQNDYNVLCGPDGVGSVMLASDADDFTRQSGIVSWLTSTPFEQFGNKPMTREQAIGVMGNLIQESYGANPYTIQGDSSMTSWQTCDNNCVLGWGSVGGKAIGIIQWDSGRRVNLVNFAIEQGTQWHDLNTQLKFLKKELDTGEGRKLVNGGFLNSSNSIEDSAYLWNKLFERSADSRNRNSALNQKREGYAREFAGKYTGGGTIAGGGLSSNCIGGMNVDTTNLVQLAIESAWPSREQSRISRCSTLVNCGKDAATPAYIQAKQVAEQNGGADGFQGLFASCDRFVATMLKATGTDVNFPWGGTSLQGEYLKNPSNGWQEIDCQNRQPGDVLWRDGHIMLYVGMVNGQDSLASASIGTHPGGRVGAIGKVYCSGRKFHADGSLSTGYRRVN